jgi:membrane protease YdiL (CAAX protease family)
VLFGLVAGYLAMRTGRLGMSVLAHAGFNATTVFLLLR